MSLSRIIAAPPSTGGGSLPDYGMAFTARPMELSASAGISVVAGWVHYFRAREFTTTPITKIGLQIGTSSGNICVGIARGPLGRANPTSIIGTSGGVACPAAGYVEIALTAPVTMQFGDWFFICADNTTAACWHAGTDAGATTAFALGFSARSNAGAYPVALGAPPAFASTAYSKRVPILLGLP